MSDFDVSAHAFVRTFFASCSVFWMLIVEHRIIYFFL